jgi:hypothetical protein
MEVVELEGMEAAAVGVAAIARADLPSAFADRGNIAGAQALLKKQRCSQPIQTGENNVSHEFSSSHLRHT